MNSLQKLLLSTLGISIAVLNAHAASAITLSIGGQTAGADGYKTKTNGATTIDFNNLNNGKAPTSGFISYTLTGSSQVVYGNSSGHYATPMGDSTRYLAVQPGGDATLKFSKAADYFGLYWGSVDGYNSLDFYKGEKLLKSFSGHDVSKTAQGSWTGASDNVYVDFFANKGESFDRVVMRSSSPAFETDNHAYRLAKSVPEPSLMVGFVAVALLGKTALRKREQA